MAELILNRTIRMLGESTILFAPCTEPVTAATPIGKREFVFVPAVDGDTKRDGYQLVDVATGCRIFRVWMAECFSYRTTKEDLPGLVRERIGCYTLAEWKNATAKAKRLAEDLGLADRIGLVEIVTTSLEPTKGRDDGPMTEADLGGLFA